MQAHVAVGPNFEIYHSMVALSFLCDFLLLTVVVPILPGFQASPTLRQPLMVAVLCGKPITQMITTPCQERLLIAAGLSSPVLERICAGGLGMFVVALQLDDVP